MVDQIVGETQRQRDCVEMGGQEHWTELEFLLSYEVYHKVEDPEEIFEECSVIEEEEAYFWDTSLEEKRKRIRL